MDYGKIEKLKKNVNYLEFQTIPLLLCINFKCSFIFEKCLQPNQPPLFADKGEG